MPIPSFTDTLGGSLGLGITIIRDGDIFGNERDAADVKNLNITRMNAELAATTSKDDIVFMTTEAPKEDIPFKVFLNSLKK